MARQRRRSGHSTMVVTGGLATRASSVLRICLTVLALVPLVVARRRSADRPPA